MIDTANVVNEAAEATAETTESDNKTLFDIEDGDGSGDNEKSERTGSQQGPQNVHEQKEPNNVANKGSSEPSQWFYDDKIKGEGMPPEWFNHKTFKNITEQARAYNEARKQITQYSEKLKAFSGAPEKYEEIDGEKESVKNNTFAIGLKELGQKIGLNQSGFNDLLDIYNKTQEIEAEKEKNNLLQQQKEELKKIGGVSKLKEMETKFIDAFGDTAAGWLKRAVKTHDDYVNLESIISSISGKTRLPVNSMESSISTREQAEELIRDSRWGKDREFTKKADKLLGHMLQNRCSG